MHGFAASDIASARSVHLYDVVVRGSGVTLMLLIALAYFTGEEFQHTHMMLGYGAAAVLTANLYWELVRPHRLRSHSIAAHGLARQLRRALAHGIPALAAIAALAVAALLGAVSLALAVVVHHVWPAVAVDEMHETVAWFALGLVVLHVAIVLIASADYLEHRLARAFRRR